MILALASVLAAQAAEPEARAIEAAQREIEALWNGGAFQYVIERAGGDATLRRGIRAVRHPRHCLSEMPVNFLEVPVGAVHTSPMRFDWSTLRTGGTASGNRVPFTVQERPIPPNVTPAVADQMRRAQARAVHYFLAPDDAGARRLAEAVRTMIRACRPY